MSRRKLSWRILLVVAGLAIPIAVVMFRLRAALPAQERDALIALYNSTNDANWKKKTHWLGAVGTECTWYGVTCNSARSNIRSLSLDVNELSGSIPTQLGNLTNLEILDLFRNQLSESIPSKLGNLTNLKKLGLGYNQLSGAIPTQLGNLTNLSSLSLGVNQLSGSIPAELGNLTNLERLTLFSNRLSGTIPARLGNLTKLRYSDITYNALYTDDSSLVSFLNSRCARRLFPGPGWQETQTIAPAGLAASPQSASSIAVSWTPIAYSSDPGRYIVLQSTLRGGPYSPAGSTASKTGSSLEVAGLRPSTTYYFVVQTVTQPHTNNRNTVASEYSSEVSAATY